MGTQEMKVMAKGNFLVIGDKTSCGGVIIQGADYYHLQGLPQARENDLVTCGLFPGVYTIEGGISQVSLEGKRMAGTLHSKSSCPCHSSLIPSITNI